MPQDIISCDDHNGGLAGRSTNELLWDTSGPMADDLLDPLTLSCLQHLPEEMQPVEILYPGLECILFGCCAGIGCLPAGKYFYFWEVP
eukprot:1161179-Pelagomonas_calceolata.AAC.3